MLTVRTLWYSSLASALLLAACGKEAAPTTAPTEATKPAAEPATNAQVKLSHFSTADGMIGFVLDRSGTPIKLRVDGEADIFELTAQEDRDRGGELHGYRLVDPTNTTRILIGTNGSVTFVRGQDQLPATADQAAQPLGVPTVAGPPVVAPPEPPAYAKLAAQLAANSVRTRFPEFDAKDSADLAKVGAAIAKADAAMFFHYVKPGKDGWIARVETVPSTFSGISYGGGDFWTDDTEAARYKSLTKHGGRMAGASSPDRDLGNHIHVFRQGPSDELADKTPGLVWEVDDSKVVFVTLDGGRYSVDLNQPATLIAPGAGPEADWPAPLQDTYADITVVSALAKAGVHPQATVDELEAIDAEWNTCVAKGWKPTRIQQNVNYAAKAVKIHQGCRKPMVKLEAALVGFIDARSKARKALHAQATARVKAVGAAK